MQAAYDADKAPLDLMLEAQRRLAEAESRHFQSLAEYAIAVKNVHYAKGTLLDYDGVVLSESGWPGKAYEDAARRDALRGKPRPLNYASARAPKLAAGPVDQGFIGSGMSSTETPHEGESVELVPLEPITSAEPAATTPPPADDAPAAPGPASRQSLVNPAAAATVTPAVASGSLADALEAAAAR